MLCCYLGYSPADSAKSRLGEKLVGLQRVTIMVVFVVINNGALRSTI